MAGHIEESKEMLEGAGYVVVKARTYRNLQERVRTAEQATTFEKVQQESTREWAVKAFDEMRRIDARLTFVYGQARAAGCAVEQLAGSVN